MPLDLVILQDTKLSFIKSFIPNNKLNFEGYETYVIADATMGIGETSYAEALRHLQEKGN